MAAAHIPDEINRHIEAVIAISKRDLLLKVLSQAEAYLEMREISAAVILGGIVLEEVMSMGDRQSALLAWSNLRNRAAHSALRTENDLKSATALLTSLKNMVEEGIGEPSTSKASRPTTTASSLRGKYAHVPTSVDEFLARKREDVSIENR